MPRSLAGVRSGGVGLVHRGVNLNGAEFGIGTNLGIGTGGTFSNVNVGTLGTDYMYETAGSCAYLYGRGVRFLRFLVRWERLQPTLNAALDTTQVGYLTAFLDRAHTAGLRVAVTPANYGAYWVHDTPSNTGVRRAIGSAQVPISAFSDFWSRLTTAIKDKPAVVAYDLCNEPVGMASAATWESAASSAVTAIRNAGGTQTISVPGYQYSTANQFQTHHPGGPWVVDPLNKIVYQAHQYFDTNQSGNFGSYATERANHGGTDASYIASVESDLDLFNTWLNGKKGWVGEVATNATEPGAVASWNALLEAWYKRADLRGMWVTAWGSGSWWGPPSSPDATWVSYYDAAPIVDVIDTGSSYTPVIEAHPNR